MNTLLAISLIIFLIALFGWHWFFAGAIVVTATVWMLIVTAIFFFSIGVLLLFVLGGVSIVALSVVGLIGFILAVVLFPLVFPILLPLLIIFLFLSFIRRRQKP